jgi:hypothetical protein
MHNTQYSYIYIIKKKIPEGSKRNDEQTIHPLKTQNLHLLPLYTMQRVKRATCRYRVAAPWRLRNATSYKISAGHFGLKPRHHQSHQKCSRGFLRINTICYRAFLNISAPFMPTTMPTLLLTKDHALLHYCTKVQTSVLSPLTNVELPIDDSEELPTRPSEWNGIQSHHARGSLRIMQISIECYQLWWISSPWDIR